MLGEDLHPRGRLAPLLESSTLVWLSFSQVISGPLWCHSSSNIYIYINYFAVNGPETAEECAATWQLRTSREQIKAWALGGDGGCEISRWFRAALHGGISACISGADVGCAWASVSWISLGNQRGHSRDRGGQSLGVQEGAAQVPPQAEPWRGEKQQEGLCGGNLSAVQTAWKTEKGIGALTEANSSPDLSKVSETCY